MLYFSYTLGLRPKECYHAKITNLNLNEKWLYIPSEDNKERQQDYVCLPDFLIPKIKSYLNYRNIYFTDSEWLFPSNSKEGYVDRTYYEQVFREALKDTGIYKISYVDTQGLNRANFTLYSLRAGFGTYAWNKTKDIKKTAILLRHKDRQLRSTMRYVSIAEEDTRKELIDEIYN